nr:SH3 domain-containing protein [uncultured Fluviicola sp.]
MKHLVYSLVIIGSAAFSCTDSSEQKTKQHEVNNTDSLVTKPNETKSVEFDPSKMECVPTAYRYGDSWSNFAPGTFGKKTYLYGSMEPKAKIIDTLKFNTAVNILAEYPDFFLICSPKGKSGYVKKSDLFIHAIFSGLDYSTYLFGITKYGTSDGTSCANSTLKIVKVNDNKEIVDTYRDSILGKDYNVEIIHNSALKNSDALFYISYSCYNEIGVTGDHFIVDNGKKLSRLILAIGSGDGGYSDLCTVYLPVTLTNGKKVVLAKNGIISVDETTGKPEFYEYPVNCGIPIEQLVIVENKTIEPIEKDEEGVKQQYNADGTEATKIGFLEVIYYQWTGTRLRKIKTVNKNTQNE